MNIEGIFPFLFFSAPFVVGFLLEAAVLYYFRLLHIWKAIGISIAINLFFLGVIFFAIMPQLGKMGYEFDGMNSHPQVVAFLWWFSSVADAVVLSFFLRKQPKARIFSASVLMNFLSYLFLYLFIVNSH